MVLHQRAERLLCEVQGFARGCGSEVERGSQSDLVTMHLAGQEVLGCPSLACGEAIELGNHGFPLEREI